MRRRLVREQNRCWKCFSPNHNSFACRKQDCASCGQKHHISLCLKKDRPQRNYSNKCRARDIVPYRPDSKGHQNRGLRSNKDQSDRRKPTSANLQMCMGTLTELNPRVDSPVSEQLVLMTAEGSIWNARKHEYEKILFFFDSGAQKTAIDEELAEHFGLARQMTEKCAMSGIGGRIETFKSHIVPLKIGTTFGEEIEITVQTRPVITEGFPSVRLEQCDVAFLKVNEIFLANTKLREELQIPRVLVGLDYYHDLVTHTGVKTPSGLHVAKTVFGHTVYGRGLSSVAQANSVSYNLTAICESAGNQVSQQNSDPDGTIRRQRSGNLPECDVHNSSRLPSTPAAAVLHSTSSRRPRRLATVRLQLLPPVIASNVHELKYALHTEKSTPVKPWSRRKPDQMIVIVNILVARCSIIDESMILILFMLTVHIVPHVEEAGLTRLVLEIVFTSQNDVVSRTRHTFLTSLTISHTVINTLSTEPLFILCIRTL
ncbi:hypothetical protein Y032_0527g2967 [Ancylostoma ceylanicum]|uniref:Peptidase A2 domain-containing protein n=1 Tax=Ancylostoma ceylanicum TaxID=53326 RepID=A0A016WRZ6_9BILA|nr:hypothetical protein Y032_0527g2967 [Ancylostoma ceylanicum]